jgi:phosphate transport system substrate-binding protein
MLKRILVIVLIGVVVGLVGYSIFAYVSRDPRPPALAKLNVGGTANVFVIVENRWRAAYAKSAGVDVKYASTGSTKGIQAMINKETAIAFTHAPLTHEQKEKAKAKGGEVVQIPVILCAVVPVYNIKELNDKPPLNFSGAVLADIFLGKITQWDDGELAKLNKGVKLPPTKIVTVHRSDSSGTTFIFADFLHGTSGPWRDKMGKPKNELSWPENSVGAERNLGVFMQVQETNGAIGYVDLLQMASGDVPYGAVENKDKTDFIHAKASNMTAAAESLLPAIPADLTFTLTNKTGKDAYPICSAIWAVCYKNQPTAQHKQVTEFLTWVVHDGQEYAEPASYAPLPKELTNRADEMIKSIKPGS